MARQDVDIGVEGNDGTGDSIRESFRKVNENFTEIYAVFGVEGSLSFLSLSDTPNTYTSNKLVTTNAQGTGIIFSSFTSSDGTIGVDVLSTPGEIDLTVTGIEISQDTTSPSLGNHLAAANFAIGGVAITEDAASELGSQPGRSRTYTIDDLVITKGYADRRYITSGLPIRVAAEPADATGYKKVISSYNGDGHLVFESGHGYDSGANGTGFIFNADNTDPSGLTSGTTYFIRFESDTELSLFTDKTASQAESDSVADLEKISVSGSIASDDEHTITDAGYNSTLTGNFLSDVAVPRESVTLRQGDTMTGALILHDHPGDLSGAGTPNGEEDLQAATKYYVDNTAYSSPEVLFVSTAGDDTMSGVPAGKEGSANTYAYRSINAAAKRASEMINTAPEEPGPYFQTLSFGATTNTAGTAATTISSAVENQTNVSTRLIMQNNRDHIIKEVTGFLAFTYPDFSYEVSTCERDLGLVIDSVSFDALRGNNANYLSRQAAERYYSSVSGRIAITSQLDRTDDSFAQTAILVQNALTGTLLNQKIISSITLATPNQTPADLLLPIASPAVVTTTTPHGLKNGNLVIFKDISGMIEIEDEILYVKVVDTTSFEIFTDSALEVPYNNREHTPFVNDTNGKIGLRYQSKVEPDESVSPISNTDNGYIAITQNFALIRNIIRNGLEAGADIVYGNRFELNVTNNTSGILDQTDPDNVDALPGKVILGKRSGAVGRIITYTQDTSATTFFLQPLEAKVFDPGEELEMGNFVKAKQVVIRVESGIYEEDYPIKLTKNVSLKGDEFRRVIVRPKRRVSQSSFANTYFYRDKEFDGITLLNSGTPFRNQVGEIQGFFGYHYLLDNTKPVNVGSAITNLGGYTGAANIMQLNRKFIQKEVGEYVDATYPALFSSESRAKCERDVGLIVDAIINDLKRGGVEGVLESQGEYYTGALTPGTETETADAIDQISNIASDILIGVNPSANGFNRSTVDVDLTGGTAESAWTAGRSYSQGDFVKIVIGLDTFYYRARKNHISVASDVISDPLDANFQKLETVTNWQEVSGSVSLVGELVDKVNFAFDADYNPPKRNDADGVDVFLMDDATIVRNVTVQGHGGFMCVLDPTGQILTKSPYIQTASSFSRSRNSKAFTGGMFVDAFAGNIPMRITANTGTYNDGTNNVGLNAFTISVESQDVGGQKQGLKLRLPELPAPFYFEGQRFQVNAISNYDSGTGRAVLYLDPGSNSGNGWNNAGTDDIGDAGHDINDVIQDIFLQTAGNRSILGNDFTQINDLGYGLVTTNGAFSEMVSMFTYYCHAAYYANNGSEIRSLNGSNGYGNFGLVAEGADPNEIPDQVTTLRNLVQPIKAFTRAASSLTNAFEDTAIIVYDFKEPPLSNAFISVDHPTAGFLNYRVSRVENLSDPNNSGQIGAGASAVVNTGIATVDNASVTGTVPGGTSEWTNVPQKSTSGSGTGAEFTISIAAGTATFTRTNTGSGYSTVDTVTISGQYIGGADGANDLTIDVDETFNANPGTYITAGLTGVVTSATTANPVVITSATHGLSNGDKVTFEAVGGMVELNGNVYYVGNKTTNTFELFTNKSQTISLNGTNFTPHTSGGTWSSYGEIGNNVYRLSLQEAGSNNDFFPTVQEAIPHNTLIDYRHGDNFIFTGVANPGNITERPSTAINFDESDLITYRSTGFTQSDDQSAALGSDEVKATFDSSYQTVSIEVDVANRNNTDPVDALKTLGGAIGDTRIAVSRLSAKDEERVVKDATNALTQVILNPGDVGYTGGMIFAHAGKVLQIIDYQPVTTKAITNLTSASPAVVTSTAHGLSNGTQIELQNILGPTELNGALFYIGNQTANTFELYTDESLTVPLNGALYDAYVSGGRWVTEDSIWYIATQDYQIDGSDWDISGGADNSGIKTAFTTSKRNLFAGIVAGTTAEITIAISLLRATGHDFTQIGTGGFNTSNYPNVLLGQPVADKAGAYSDADDATKAQVWERRKGRVFFISSDENGFFRVGKYFQVDQSTGSITFAGEVGISRAASLGFKDGVTIDEFSNDELFTDLSDTAVPTEKAVANYISRRLGHNGSIQLTGSARFDPGFMALNGSTKMEANLNMNSKQIKNLLDPTDDNDATTKDFVDAAVSNYDELDDLRNVLIHDRTGSGDEANQILVPTGLKRIVCDATSPQGYGTIVPTDIIKDNGGSAVGTVVATEERFDNVLNQNVFIITYNLTSPGDFGITFPQVFVGATYPGTKGVQILEASVDEFTNAKEDSASDINITVNRSANDTTINLQIEPDAILNADVNPAAEIAQSKLNLDFATTRAAAPTGTDQQKQATLGVATFDSGDFSVTDGFVTLKEHGIDFDDLPELGTDTVIGRSAANTGDASAVGFSTIIDEGGGLEDSDFTTERPYFSNPPTNTIVNDPGTALIQIGTAGDGSYAYSDISYVNTGNSIAKRTNTGALHANTLIIGGASSYEILSESSQNLLFKTPDQGTILTASGATKPTINTGGKIKVGDIANVNESVHYAASTFGTGNAAEEVSAIAARWMYSSFIEAPGDTDGTGTGVGLGAGTGFGLGGDDVVHFVTNGNVEARVTTTGLESDNLKSISTDTDLLLSGNGTGKVRIQDNLQIDGSLTLNVNTTNAIVYEGTANSHETRLRFTDPTADRNITFPNATGTVAVAVSDTTTTTQGDLNINLSLSASGAISGVGDAHGLASGDSPTFAGLSISSTNDLLTRRITTGAAATTGIITGRWSLSASSRFEATYADLAEYYEGDVEYPVGTVIVFGGDKEVTISTEHRTTRIAGVVSDQSAYTMNQECPGIKVLTALQGKVPVNVIGAVSKGDMLVASAIPGYAVVDNNPRVGSVIGKAIGTKDDTERGTVHAVVGRV